MNAEPIIDARIERDKEVAALLLKIENYKLRIANFKTQIRKFCTLNDLEMLKQALRETAKEL